MGSENDLQEALDKFFDRKSKDIFTLAKVTKINKDDTVDVEVDGFEMYDISLKSIIDEKDSSVVLVPEVGSDVLIGRIAKSDTGLFVSKVNDLKEIKIHFKEGLKAVLNKDSFVIDDGKNGGLILIEELLKKVNRLESNLKSHQHLYIPYPGGVPAATVPTTKSPSNAFVNTTRKDIENQKVKH